MDVLTPKQQLFVMEYLVDLNATRAAKAAGYSERTAESQGSRLLSNVKVAAAIQSAMDDRSARTGITQDYVLDTIKETIDRCRQVEPVLDKKGNQIMVKTRNGDLMPAFVFDSNAVLKGCELLGRNLKLWKDVGSKDNPEYIVPVEVVFGDED